MSKHATLLFFAISIILLLFQINGLFGRDAGVHISIANGIIKGKLPYRDYFFVKMPGILFTYAGVIAAFGRNILAIRTFSVLINMLIVYFIIQIAKVKYDMQTGMIAASFYMLSASMWRGIDIMTEPFVALFGLIAFLIYLKKNDEKAFFLIGLCIGISTIFKQVGVFYLLAFLLLAIIHKNAKKLIALSIGFSLPIIILASYLSYEGALSQFYECVVLSLMHRGRLPANELLYNAITVFISFPLLWLSPLFSKKRMVPLFLIIIFSLLPSLTRCHEHYFLTTVPFLALPAASFFIKNKKSIFLLIPTFLLVVYADANAFVGYENQIEVGKEICKLTSNEHIIILGAEPIYYFMSNKEPIDDNLFYMWSNEYRYNESTIISNIEKNNISLIVIPYEYDKISGKRQNGFNEVIEHCRENFYKKKVFEFASYRIELWLR